MKYKYYKLFNLIFRIDKINNKVEKYFNDKWTESSLDLIYFNRYFDKQISEEEAFMELL